MAASMSWTTFIFRLNFSVWLMAARWTYLPLRKPRDARSQCHRLDTSLHSAMAAPLKRFCSLTAAVVSMASRRRVRSP